MSNYHKDMEKLNNKLILEGSEMGPFSENFMKKVQERDFDIIETPYRVSEELIKDINIDAKKIQDMINYVDKFKDYTPEIFSLYGVFISEMMEKYLKINKNLFIDTMNNSKVHISDYYISNNGVECSYPWKYLEKIKEYNRDNLLISNLASKLKEGDLKITGNVGNFFASRSKSNIQLNGECGWRPCYGLSGGIVKINGIAGHDLASNAYNGKIFVNGDIRSIGNYYSPAYSHEIFINGIMIPKEEFN